MTIARLSRSPIPTVVSMDTCCILFFLFFFYIFIDLLCEGIVFTICKSLNYTKLGGSVDLLDGRKSLKRAQDRLYPRAKAKGMRFHKMNCWALNIGHNSPLQFSRLRAQWLECSPVRKDLADSR